MVNIILRDNETGERLVILRTSLVSINSVDTGFNVVEITNGEGSREDSLFTELYPKVGELLSKSKTHYLGSYKPVFDAAGVNVFLTDEHTTEETLYHEA